MKHRNIIVRGKVQGVFFRASAQEYALGLGLRGYVRNLPDGGVYLEAEGENDSLDALIVWCKRGPQHAVVQDVAIAEGELMNFTGFEIRR